MKKYLLLTVLFAKIGWNINAQIVGTVTATIGDYFVSGISPVNNTITASEPSANWINFYLLDKNDNPVDSSIDYTGGNTYRSWTYDMGDLDSGYYFRVDFYDNNGDFIGNNYYTPNIIKKPVWLSSGYGNVSDVNVVGNHVQMIGHFSFTSQNNSMPSDIPGLRNRPYNLVNPEITVNIDFDCETGQSTVTDPNTTFNLNIFNQSTYSYNYPLTNNNGLSFDENFNPQISIEGTYTPAQFEINWPLAKFYPLFPSPYPSLKIDGGLKINANLKGKLLYGYNTTFDEYGIDTARVTAKINGTAILRAKADALIASASGTLIAKGSIGGGLVYSDFPSPNTTPLFGMDLKIAGAIDYKLGKSFFTLKEGHLEKTFYQKTWGNQLKVSPFEKQIWDNVDAKGNYTQLLQANPYFTTPNFFAQPCMSANDSALYIVWLDTSGTYTNILFSKLNYQKSTFSTPQIVHSAEVISNPKVAILPSGNALISWTENRYNSGNFDTTTMDLTDLLQAQDIWVTLYDKQTNSFVTPVMLSDINTGPQSGRAEGNANIIMGKGPYGLITWVVSNDTLNDDADVWYCTVAEIGNNVFLGTPTKLIDLPGTNRLINISYYDTTHAIATWINDPDGNDSTLNNQIVYMFWTQTSDTSGNWGPVETLIENSGSVSFDDVSLDFNGIYGAVAWTTTEYTPNGDFQKGIYASAWDWSTQNWANYSYALSPDYSFLQPKVSVNKNGFITLTYQAIELFDDTLTPDVGQLNLYMNDSQNNPTYWQPNNGNGLIGDSSVYVWDMNTTFGNQNNFYIITQEADTITGNAPINPPNGIRFGNLYLNLVMRSVNINDFVITDIPEPSTHSTNTKGNAFNFNMYPNPISEYATIEYSIDNPSNVSIEIFDLMGRKVANVFTGDQNAGTYKAIFQPNGLINGIYLCKMTVNNQTAVKKMIIAK